MRYSEDMMVVYDGYCYVINNETSLDNCDSESGNPKKAGIKMSVVRNINYDLEEFYEDFEYQVTEEENPFFEDHFRQALRGESDLWKLICVKIYHRQMWMDFACNCDFVGKTVDKSMICQESVAYNLGEREGYVKLRFETSGLNNSGTTQTTVSFGSGENTIITEKEPCYKKKIYLPGHKIDGFCALRTEKWY